ncbi:MAG: Spy/CpxP family protein refolding chaperone [Candidatus Binatia bacterium]
MKKGWSLVGSGLIMLGLSSVTAYGQERRALPGPGAWMPYGASSMLPIILRGVNLTLEQNVRVEEIMATHRPTFNGLNKQLQAVHREIADKLFAPGEVRSQDLAIHVQRIVLLRSQLLNEGIKVMLEIRGVLTPEQLAKASQIKQRMQELRGEYRSVLEKNR